MISDDIPQLLAALRAGYVSNSVAFDAADTIGTLAKSIDELDEAKEEVKKLHILLSIAFRFLEECNAMDNAFDMLCGCSKPEIKLYDKRVALYNRVMEFIKECKR